MTVRHLVARENVTPDGAVIDPHRVRHGALRAGAVYAVAGEIDPATHLNLDFPDHRVDACVVVERLAAGAPALTAGGALRLARVPAGAHTPRGEVDAGARRAAWLSALRERRLSAEAART